MKKIINLLFVVQILLLLSGSKIYAQSEVPVHLKDLKELSRDIDNMALNEKKIFSMGYSKRMNGVYISTVMLTAKAPKHWIITSLYLTFQTAEKASWDRILNELNKEGKAKKFKGEANEISYRYSIPKYTVEIYKPRNGIDLSLNNLYQVMLIPKRK